MATMAAAQPGIGIYCDPSIAGLLRGGPKGPWTITGKMVQNAGFTERTDQTPNVRMKGDFATGQNKLRLPTGSLTAICQWGLPEGYISDDLFGQIYDETDETWKRPHSDPKAMKEFLDDDEIEEPEANLILILYDNLQTEKGVRGIALCHVDEKYSKLLVLGANRPGVEIRNRAFATGGMLLRLVQYLFSDLGYIELFALETVITLYYHFGWRFIVAANCEGKGGEAERASTGAAVEDLKELLKTNPTEENLTKALSAFRGFAAKRAEKIRTGEAFDDDGNKIATEEARENGYRMILCKIDNPYYQEQGGGKRFARRQKAGASINTNIGNEEEEEDVESIFEIITQSPKHSAKRRIQSPTHSAKRRRIRGGGKKRTKKRALRKKHRGRKTKGKKKKNKKWCKSTKAWCKYTKKNNCKKGLWKKKTKLGRASRRWCRSTKRWCKVRKTACKKKRR